MRQLTAHDANRAEAIVIPNFKHPGACLEGPERSQETLRGLEEPTVCTKKVLDSGGWRLALAAGAL